MLITRPPIVNSWSSDQPNQHSTTAVLEWKAATNVPPDNMTPASNTVQASNSTQTSTQPIPVTTMLMGSPQSVLFNPGESRCLLKTAVTEVISDKISVVANVLFNEGARTHLFHRNLQMCCSRLPLGNRSSPWYPSVLMVCLYKV